MMRFLYWGLVSVSACLTAVSLYFAVVPRDLLMHFFFGLIATVSVLLTHCWVFFYFIGTGEGIREGIHTYGLDQSAVALTKKFKARTFPFALFSMIFMIIAAVLGGGAARGKTSAMSHYIFVGIAVLFNIYTVMQEHKVIGENHRLMESLNQQIDRQKAGSFNQSQTI